MRIQSTAAKASQLIRKDLKIAFPEIKFSVRSHNYSGGHSINVEWDNGPTSESLDKIVGKYKHGRFDMITDIYSYKEFKKDLPQVDYVFSNRTVSEEIYQDYFEEYKKTHKNWNIYCDGIDEYDAKFYSEWSACTPREFISRVLCKKDLTHYQKEI